GVWVGVLVVDDEAGVEPECSARDHVFDRVRMSAGAVVALEQLDVVAFRQGVRGSQTRDSRADHCELQSHTLDTTRTNFAMLPAMARYVTTIPSTLPQVEAFAYMA